MDVHLRSTTVCALDAETGEAVTRRFRGNPWGEVAEWMSGFPGPSLAAYESGYLGFAPQRELSGLGVDCVVAAVSKVPRSAADLSSKNDRNDAARMAKAILSHDISPVWVPSPEIEGAGTSPGPTTRRPRGSRRRSSGSWRSWPAVATPTAARRRPETPGGTGRTTSSGGSTRSGPPTTAASGRLRR